MNIYEIGRRALRQAEVPRRMGHIIAVITAILLPHTAAAKEPLAWVTLVYRVSPTLFTKLDTRNSEGLPEPLHGVSLRQPHKRGDISYDVKGWFWNQGIPFPDESEAIYVLNGEVLFIKNILKNVDLIDSLYSGMAAEKVPQITTEITMGTFSLPGNEEITLPLPYVEFIKRAGKTWHVVAHINMLNQSGLHSKASHHLDATSAAPATDLKADLEQQVGLVTDEIDNAVEVNFRGPLTKGAELSELSVISQFSCWNGYPILIHLSKIENVNEEKGSKLARYVAVVMKTQVNNPGGFKFKRASNK